jgi:hypothetical protein
MEECDRLLLKETSHAKAEEVEVWRSWYKKVKIYVF